MGSIRRARELSDIAPQYIAKSGLCGASELESTRWGSIRIQHVTGLANLAEGKSRFPKLDECAHFHYEHVEIGPLQVSIVDDDNLKPLFNEAEEGKWWSLSVNCQNKTWLIRRSYDNFRMLDQQLHRCIYDRKFSELAELPEECIENQENLRGVLADYMKRFSAISGNLINCGPVLNWLELDNRGHRLLVPDNDNCPINTPAVAAAYSIKRYTAQAPDEISFEVGDMISVIDKPPPEESIWWHGKRGFQVGFFPCECVAVIGDKVPRNIQFSPQITRPMKPVLRKHGKLIAFFRSFILSRPSRRRLKQSGILKERVFGCDLGEHLLNSGHEIPMVLKCCVEFIETHGLIDGIYRLSGITSNIQKLRNAFDEDRVPALYEDEAILQDVHSVASLLKMYFRELPNPLCTYQLYHQFVEAVQLTQEEDYKLLKMRDVVQKLPPPHYRTLGYLMRHLARVSEKGHETGMTSRNVAIVWAPNLLRCKELEVGGVAALQGVGVQAVVTEFLVCYADLIFCDRLPKFSLPTQQGNSKKCRPKSLAISTPTKLLSLEEARTRAFLQASGRPEPEYIEVGGGPANLPAKYHTVIELPGYSRKGTGSKRSPIGWKLLFGKSGRSSQSRKETDNKSSTPCHVTVSQEKKTTMELDLAQSRRYLRPAKSAESLDSSRNSEMADLVAPLARGVGTIENSLSPALLRSCEGKSNGHNRSVSHESYFQDQFQDREKENLTSDISEIQMNFDLEESEMKILSEDETLASTGSGSLASNCSPQVPRSKKGEKTMTSSVKRLSQPKLTNAEDRYESSQTADPSPKKQKTNDENSISKLEEQLSSSVGEIQFIDSVSPDQGLAQSDLLPIQSPSPVSSISQLNSSSLLPSSSPILPQIPHLIKSYSETSEFQNSTDGCTGLEATGSPVCESAEESNVSLNSFFENRLLGSHLNKAADEDSNSCLSSPSQSLLEATVSDRESCSFLSSKLLTPETPICSSSSSSSYTPLVEFEESNSSDVTTPDAYGSGKPANSASEKFQNAPMNSCSELVNCRDSPEEVSKCDAKILSGNDRAEAKPQIENLASAPVESEESMKHVESVGENFTEEVHSRGNIPIATSESEELSVLNASSDGKESATTNLNSELIVSIRYESISTESSCDSLIVVNKDGGEDTLPLTCRFNRGSPSADCLQANLPKVLPDGKKVGEHEETSLSGKNLNGNDERIGDFSDGPSPMKSNKSEPSESEESAVLSETERLINPDLGVDADMENLEVSVTTMTEDAKMTATSTSPFSEGEALLAEGTSVETEEESVTDKKTWLAPEEPSKKQEEKGGVLETDLDALEDVPGLVFGRSTDEKNSRNPKKEVVPQKSSSSENVRQLMSKFEMGPAADRKNCFEAKPDLGGSNEGKSATWGKSHWTVDEENESVKRPAKWESEKDSFERTRRFQLGKSKSGSQINKKWQREKEEVSPPRSDFDLSDPQRRERIEKYKEKRRNYLREKYRCDSFKNEKDDFASKIRQRHLSKKDWEEEVGDREGRSASDPSQDLSAGKGSPEKRDRAAGPRFWRALDPTAKESGQRSSLPAESSPSTSLRKSSLMSFGCEGGNAYDLRRIKSSPEKKSLFPNFSLGRSSSREEVAPSRESTRRKKEVDGTKSSECSVPAADSGPEDPRIPVVCIKDMTALFERRNEPKPAKQYLSSV